MKKILLAFVLPVILFGCGTPNFADKVAEKVEKNAASIAVNELTDFKWNSVYVLHPYEKKTVGEQKFEQTNSEACNWIFLDAKENFVKNFEIERSVVDCIDLPTQPFRQHEALFLLNDGKLKMRKIFKLNR